MRASTLAGCVVVASIVITGCSAKEPGRPAQESTGSIGVARPVGDALSVAVAPDTALSVEVPSVGTISGPVGAFSSTGTITIHAETATFAADSGLDAAGPGVDVAFEGTALRKPLTVVFVAHPGSVPINILP